MPERTKYAPGTPSWIDLTTPDTAAAKRFYGALFGWEFTDEGTDDPSNPAGRMAVCADPTGAVFCLWQSKDHIGAELVNEHGTLTWNEIMTPDIAKASEFYVELFGWAAEVTDLGPMQYTSFLLKDRQTAGGMSSPADGIPAHWGVYFCVDDTDALVEQAKGLGATVFAEPTDIPPGRFATLTDPQGAMFNVLTWSEPTD